MSPLQSGIDDNLAMSERVFVTGADGAYSIGSDGVLMRHSARGVRVVTWQVHRNGYAFGAMRVGGKWVKRSISRLVAQHFLAPPSLGRNEVNHIDCNKLNNRVENLEWVTHAENIRHAVASGRWRGKIIAQGSAITQPEPSNAKELRRIATHNFMCN